MNGFRLGRVVWLAALLALMVAFVACSILGEEEDIEPDRQVDDDDVINPPGGGDDDDTVSDDDTTADDDATDDDDDDDDDDDNDDNDDDDDDDDDDDNDDASPVPPEMIIDESNGYTDIAIDTAGNPRVVYYHRTDGLKHAAWNGSQWSVEIVDGSSLRIGTYAAVAMDASRQFAHIAYRDETRATLRAAAQTAKGWETALVDDSADVGAWCDIVVDGSTQRFISYHDATNGDLKFARNLGAAWETEVIEDGESLGLYTSLAVDDGVFYISYYDAAARSLKVATGGFGAWTIETVDAPGSDDEDVGRWSSLGVDAFGNLHVAYQDAGLLDLKYAYKGADWAIQTVHAIGNKGADACLLVNPSTNRPHIIYQDGSNLSLLQTFWDGTQWQRGTMLDGHAYEGSFGFWIGCTFRPAGPVVSHYYELENKALIYPAYQ